MENTADSKPASQPAGFDLEGRVAVICGAASDIGRACALGLASAGARIVVGDLDEAGLATTTEALGRGGFEATSQAVDVTDRRSVEALVGVALDRYAGLDVMANLAGVIVDRLVLDTEESELDRVLDVNLKGVFFGCQVAAAAMAERGGGSIVNMSSTGAFTPIQRLGSYSMSKAAVVALTRVLAAEVGSRGVRVNAIAPGFIEGGMTFRHVRSPDGVVSEEDKARVLEKARKRNVLDATGTPEDVASAVLYLASPTSRYVTGQVLHPNGGSYMP